MKKLIVLAGLAVITSTTFAGNIKSAYTYDFLRSVTFTTVGYGTQSVNTARIRGSRLLDGGVNGGGTDTILPKTLSNANPFQYFSYCAEIGEHISNKTYTHANVSYLGGSSTNTGAPFGSVFFDPTRTMRMQKLWGNYSVTSDITAAAFQLAQWEIAFDTDMTLAQGANGSYGNSGFMYLSNSQMNSGLNLTIKNTAESMLTAIRTNTVTRQAQLVLLSGGGVQDQIVAINGGGPGPSANAVPEPFTMGLGLAAVAAFVRRRTTAKGS